MYTTKGRLRSAIEVCLLLVVSILLLHNVHNSPAGPYGITKAAILLSRFLVMACASLLVLNSLKSRQATKGFYLVIAVSLGLWIPTFISP